MSIVKSASWKHLGLILEASRTINDHINDKNGNQINAIGLYFFTMFSFKSAVSKSFMRPHLDYGDVIYDQPSNATFSGKNESVQCDAVLAITEAFRGLSRERLPGIRTGTSTSQVLEEKTLQVLQSTLKYSSKIHQIYPTNEILFKPILGGVGGDHRSL